MECPGLQLHHSNLCPCCHMTVYSCACVCISLSSCKDNSHIGFRTHSAALKAELSRTDFSLCQGRGPERTKTSPKVTPGTTAGGGEEWGWGLFSWTSWLEVQPPAPQPTLSHHLSSTGAPCLRPRISRVTADRDGSGRSY